jgi:hypothetical protein
MQSNLMPSFDSIQHAVNNAKAGDTICVATGNYENERVHITTSGTASAPIVVKAVGKVLTSGFVVEASYVTIDGFNVSNQGSADESGRNLGVYLSGTGLRIINNIVLDTKASGIGCEVYPPGCFDTLISGNVVQGADGTGILVAGERILVENNDVSRSIMVNETDADGMRFFGSHITFRGNYIHDIFDRGYPKDTNPHTDCFQTFDNDKPASNHILIENNICLDVDHQCLIVEGLLKKQSDTMTFRNNICGNSGSQAVLVRGVPGVSISNNLFLSSIVYHGILIKENSPNALIANNIFLGTYRAYNVDESSLEGLIADYNLADDPSRPSAPSWWKELHGIWGVDPMFAGPVDERPGFEFRPQAASPVVDSGSSSLNDAATDIEGRPRVTDGNKDGVLQIDMGPFEYQGSRSSGSGG